MDQNPNERVDLWVPRERRAAIQAAADGENESLHDFILRAVDEHMEKAEKRAVPGPELCRQMESLLDGETDWAANLSNASALLKSALSGVNWVGFYRIQNGELLAGPFQGLPACVHIPIGKGVCGTAVRRGVTLYVPDVHRFPGHIACDARSASELVVPLRAGGRIVGVLDIDSPLPDRFDASDIASLEKVAALISQKCRWDV